MDSTKMLALDKFKRGLVRDIARRIHQERQTDQEMWVELEKEYGCDCISLWNHMRALTLKKLKRLLAAQDRIDCITRIARMTSTDWLTFDLVLVHDKTDVIGEEQILNGKPEPAVLSELVDLVQKYDIENLPSKSLIEAWFNLTKEYNTGGRQCSPLLLQRRWYQLKELTRTKVYKFWKLYRGNVKQLEKANVHRPTSLQLTIAARYPNIITHQFETWSDLILKKRVVLAGAFCHFQEKKRVMRPRRYTNDNDPDLVVIEPNMETIDVAADSDNDVADYKDENIEKICTKTKSHHVLQPKENIKVTIKTESPDEVINIDEEENIVQQLQSVAIPVKNNEELGNVTLSTESTEVTDSELTEIPGLKLPKITSVMGNVMISESYTEINELIENRVNQPNLNEECANFISKTSLGDNVVGLDKVKIDDNNFNCNSNIVPNLDELPLDLNFVDDGIVVADYDFDIDEEKREEREDEQEENEVSKKNEDTTTKIDKKLIMFPISYTTKLDDMNIFKDKSYLYVQDDYIIKCAILESKPYFKDIFSGSLNEDLNTDLKAGTDESVNKDQTASDDSESYEVPRVNYTSSLLQKPKNRNYNPIQLCKNPDFNTRLKRLTVGFFSIERNRQLFNACKPLTIDLHKQFENKLVNNTLYLKNTNSFAIEQEKNNDTCKNTVSVIPSAIPVQSLLVNSKVNVEDLLSTKVDKVEPVYPVESPVSESNNVIDLSDIDQLRLVNKNLLTAEISPMPLNDASPSNNPPVQLITYPSPDTKAVNEIQTSSVPLDDNQKISSTSRKNNKEKRILPKKSHIPKIKSSGTMPAWSCLLQEPVDDSLITKDTLDKVLCLLNGTQVNDPKKKKKANVAKAARGTSDVNNSNSFKINEVNDHSVNAINDDELNKSVAFLQTQNTELSKIKEIIEPVKPSRSVPARTKYCCWARGKLQNFENTRRGPKPRHRCLKSLCICCCRNLLLKVQIGEEKYFSANNDSSTYKEDEMLKTQETKTDISFYGNENNVVKNCLPFNEVQQSDSQNDFLDITNDPNSECSIQSPLPTNIVPNSVSGVQFPIEVNAVLNSSVCLKNYVTVDTNDIFTHRKSDERSISKHSESYIEPDTVLVPQATRVLKKKVNILRKPSLKEANTIKANNNSETEIETISLLEDEPIKSSELSPPPIPVKDMSFKSVLPKGVNLVLLPDNTLSVNINPDVVIDQESLSKLPVVLTAVQKHLNTTILQAKSQSNESDADKSNGDLNVLSKILTDQNLQQNVIDTTIESNILSNEPDNLAEETCNKLNNGNLQVDTSEVCLDNSDNSLQNTPVNLETNDKLHESDISCTNENKGKPEAKQSEEIHEAGRNCTQSDINRKTILSDLMTMSGISQEDINNIVEGPVSLPPTVINNSQDDPLVVNNEKTPDKPYRKKIVKKIMISIRKKSQGNGQLESNSVIDLTEDNNTTSSKMETNETTENDSSLQSLLKKCTSKFRDLKPVHLNVIPKPVKRTKAPNKSLLRNAKKLKNDTTNTKTISYEEVDGRLKMLIAKHYRQYNKKPTLLSILQSNGEIMEVQYNQNQEQKSESDSDSSDDEPLAKKFKRIRSKRDMDNHEQADDITDNIIEVPKYDLPIEFSNQPTEIDEINDNIDSSSEIDGNCILGV